MQYVPRPEDVDPIPTPPYSFFGLAHPCPVKKFPVQPWFRSCACLRDLVRNKILMKLRSIKANASTKALKINRV